MIPSHFFATGSERRHPRNSVEAGELGLNEDTQITLVLRRKQDVPTGTSIERHLSHHELMALHGADNNDIVVVEAFAHEHQLSIARVHRGARTVQVVASLGKLMKLFRADLRLSAVGSKLYRTQQGSSEIPESLAGVVIAVLGFDERADRYEGP